MDCKRHIVLDCPDTEDQVQIYEYETNMVIWLGTSPEIYTPKIGKTTKEMVSNFIIALQNDGWNIINELTSA